MRSRFPGILCVLAATVASHAQTPLPAQIPQVKYSRGQDVVPAFEGWLRNRDGTFTFVFGYFNRNWEEELAIPPGPDNMLEPGPVDRGQPTYFLPRRQRWLFRVQAPADWGSKELVWSVTAHGRTQKAYASLLPAYEITERMIMTRGNLNPGEDDPNHPPLVTIEHPEPARLAEPVTLTAMVADDGLPKPREEAAPRPGAQVNRTVTARPKGLSVTWLQSGGPAKVLFDSADPILVADGKAVTAARFPRPGTYVLRATANDGALSTDSSVTVTVE